LTMQQKHKRALTGLVILALVFLLWLVARVVSFPVHQFGEPVWGVRSDIFLWLLLLSFVALPLFINALSLPQKVLGAINNLSLLAISLVFCMAVLETYLSFSDQTHYYMPAELKLIEERYVEEGLGFRFKPGPYPLVATVPHHNIPWVKKHEDIMRAEEHQVNKNLDAQGFLNESIPEKADVVTLGDSFVFDVDIKQGWSWVDLV